MNDSQRLTVLLFEKEKRGIGFTLDNEKRLIKLAKEENEDAFID
ncbi:hypothetical protein SFC57_24175 [Niallia circulans]